MIFRSSSVRNYTLVLLFLLLLGMGSCEDKDEGPAILGKWKLEKVQTVFYDPQVYDYSGDNIIYDFKRNGKLIVSSDIEDYRALDIGEHAYSYKDDILTLRGIDYMYTISNGELVIDLSYVDGPIFYFVKI